MSGGDTDSAAAHLATSDSADRDATADLDSDHTAAVQTAFTSGEFPVAVYGLGKMGLPLAGVFAEVSGNVTGVDVDPAVVATINDGDCHVTREPGLDSLVAEQVETGRLSARSDPAGAAEAATIHVVIVPTPITDDHEPDLSILDSVIEDIGTGLSAGDLVIIECTVPPRTTADRVTPRLAAVSGLDPDEFGVAFCPERTSSGQALADIRGAYPKVVGGVDAESTAIGAAIYETINDAGVIPVTDATTAECVKVFEGLYRDVNIALANELGRATDAFGIDVREAIAVANTQPFCDIHDPGPGVGGHCIPFYPYFVIEPFETETPLLETARAVNDGMPGFTVAKLREEFGAEGFELAEASVLVLGLTYRPGVEEIRASPALSIAEALSEAGAEVVGVDPVLSAGQAEAFELEYRDIGHLPFEGDGAASPVEEGQSQDSAPEQAAATDYDGIILVTPHEEFEGIDWAALGREGGSVVIDGRNTLDLSGTDHRVYTIGSGHQ